MSHLHLVSAQIPSVFIIHVASLSLLYGDKIGIWKLCSEIGRVKHFSGSVN